MPTKSFSTYFGLLAEFGTAELPLESIAEKYFGLAPPKAKSLARLQQLPVPAYRCGSNKSPWLIAASDLADWLDTQKEQARAVWQKMQPLTALSNRRDSGVYNA